MSQFDTFLSSVGLTPREVAIVELVAKGLSNAEISIELNVTEKTVKSRLTQVYRVLKVRDRSQLIVKLLTGL